MGDVRRLAGAKPKKGTTSKEKGDVVEQVVAMMHEGTGVEVRRDIRLPAKRSGKRGRQIDVLLVGEFGGYPEMRAIECKNFGRPLNVRDVGVFRDLLEDVGLAPQQGILVSASRIGPNAKERADELGIKVFELSGLTPDRLSSALHEATQRVVVVVPAMSHLVVTDNVGPEAGWEEIGTFYDREGNVVGMLPDLLWFKWLEGAIPSTLGEHAFELEVPEEWHRLIDGRREPIVSISATAKVHAAVVEVPGQATAHALIDPSGPAVQRYRARMSFGTEGGDYTIRSFSDEGELDAYSREQSAFSITVGRIRAPRMIINHIY
jgi:hypothetical protein